MGYRLKLAVTISLLIAVALGIGGALIITTSFHTLLEQEKQAAFESFEAVQKTLYLLNSLGEQTDFDGLVDALRQMEQQNMIDWQGLQLCASGDILFQSGLPPTRRNELPKPDGERCGYLPVADESGHGLLVLGLLKAGDAELELLARFDLSQVYALRETQQRQYLVIYVAVMAFGVVAAVLFSHMLTRPLRGLTDTVRDISAGDLSKRSGLRSHDEIGQLSRDFDDMADKLQASIAHLEDDVHRQEQFMGAFAHELKTPMTSIIGFADLLRQDSLEEKTRMMAAKYIYSEAHRLERLSFRLLDLLLLNKEGVVRRKVRLAALLGEVDAALSPGLRQRGIRLVCRAEQRAVMIEPDLVKSLVYNLIDNAAKAIDGDGAIAVSVTTIPGGCQIQVTDNGRGMERDELSKITEAFYRVDKARSRGQGGAGLGLALCKRIAQLHGGSISFQSAPGKGTRVTATLYESGGEENAQT